MPGTTIMEGFQLASRSAMAASESVIFNGRGRLQILLRYMIDTKYIRPWHDMRKIKIILDNQLDSGMEKYGTTMAPRQTFSKVNDPNNHIV